MSKASEQLVAQAQRLCDQARSLPVDEGAKVLEQVATMAQAAQAEVLIDGERRGDLVDTGCRTVRSFAASVLRRGPDDATKMSRVARHLACFPALADAYRSGLAHTGNLRAVLDQLPSCGLELLQAYEAELLSLVTRAGPHEIREFCAALVQTHKPDADADKVRAHGSRWVRIARLGDLAHLDAMLDPVVADQLKATVAAMAKASRTVDDPRSHGERSADALEGILRTGMDASELPKKARRRPHTTLHVQLATLLGMPEHGRALLERFGLIPTSTAARITCDSLVRVVLEHGARVLNVGHTHRVVTDRQHAALAATYQSCVFPGCQVKFSDCAIHHLWWHSMGGPTDLDLQLPVCESHHIWLHEGGYSITREDGLLVFRDSRGRTIANLQQVLTEQLDLLRRRAPSPPADTAALGEVLSSLSSWPDSPYLHATWGWSGAGSGPPPGHDPPRRSAAV